MTLLARLFRSSRRDLVPVPCATSPDQAVAVQNARAFLSVAVELGELVTRPNKPDNDGKRPIPCTLTAEQDARLRQLDLHFGLWLQRLDLHTVFKPLIPKRGGPDFDSLQGRWELLPHCQLLVWKRPATYTKGGSFDLSDGTVVNASDEWIAAMRALIGVVEGMANLKVESVPGIFLIR